MKGKEQGCIVSFLLWSIDIYCCWDQKRGRGAWVWLSEGSMFLISCGREILFVVLSDMANGGAWWVIRFL